MAKYDIYKARVYYADSKSSKERPIIQTTDDCGEKTKYVFISGSKKAIRRCEEGYPGDFMIENWMEAGLDKRSVGRLTKELEGSPTLLRKYGTLHPSDINRLKLKSVFPKSLIEKHKTESLDDSFDWRYYCE